MHNDCIGEERDCKLAIKLESNFSMAHKNYCRLLCDVHADYEGAEHEFKLAIKVNPNSSLGQTNFAYLQERKP